MHHKEPSNTHTCDFLYLGEISPKYHCTSKYTNSLAALTHFLGSTLDKGMPQCVRLWSVTAAAMSKGSSFKAQSSRFMCAMAIGSCLQGLGSFSRAPLSATRTWIRNLPDWAAATRTKAPVRKCLRSHLPLECDWITTDKQRQGENGSSDSCNTSLPRSLRGLF